MSAKLYNVIYADPPWSYDDQPRRAGITYPTMAIEDIKALPVTDLAAKDCALFIWVTMPLLQEGLDTIKAWGFKYTTCAFSWVKQNPANDRKHPAFFFPQDKDALNIFAGMGRWTMGNVELCLLGKRGKPQRQSKGVKQVIVSPRGRHSEKPDEARKRIVQLMGDVPRVELFARQKVEGWDAFGNEVESDIQLPTHMPPLTTSSFLPPQEAKP